MGDVIRKEISIEVKELREGGGRILINTGAVDRDRDRVLPIGAQIENYMRNPVVQWGHNYFEPWATIGRTNSLEMTEDGIIADFELRPAANEHDPQNVIRLLWEGGWVRTASVGFIPGAFDENDAGGLDYTAWELLEWSLVPIPANQEALRLAVKGLGDEPEGTREIDLTCIGCGAAFKASMTLSTFILTGQALQFCEDCIENVNQMRQNALGVAQKAAQGAAEPESGEKGGEKDETAAESDSERASDENGDENESESAESGFEGENESDKGQEPLDDAQGDGANEAEELDALAREIRALREHFGLRAMQRELHNLREVLNDE